MDDKCRSFLKENGINADAALEFMMGSERMFEKYLYRFTEDPTFSELFSSIKEQRREEARIAAHSLKSITATLGFTELNRLVKAQELAFKEERWDDGVAMEPDVQAEYQRICKIIEQAKENSQKYSGFA